MPPNPAPLPLRRAGWALCLGLAACVHGDVTEPGGVGVPLVVRANVSATSVALVVVQVTAPDITTPLVFNIPVSGGIAVGSITLPAGSNRAITMRAYDALGIETHRGSTTINVREGTNPTIQLRLTPLSGQVPIDVELGSVTVTVVPGGDTLLVGDTTVLTARVVDENAEPVSGPVAWATLAPGIATVAATSDSTATVITRGTGVTQIVATFAGVGAAATIAVSAGPAAEVVATGLSGALFVTAPPGDTARIFVVRRGGTIQIIENGTLLSTPFLDVSTLIVSGGEQGLLGMAFHPDYAVNGYFYVDYTDLAGEDSTDQAGDTRLVRYQVSADPNVADPASALELLFVNQPFDNHNGGHLEFGSDGMLYFGLGDGGGVGDPNGEGQDSTTLFGSILRLDVDGGAPYAIPPDNPFAGHPTARPEIWAYGLRNPWRFSIDPATNDLYIADVGQDSLEEIDIRALALGGGENYGWSIMEGTACFTPATGCNQTGLILPAYAYPHAEGCSITGGSVYRGTRMPALAGRYFFADFCGGWVRSFRYSGGVVSDVRDHTATLGTLGLISSLGRDGRGELYVANLSGTVYRFVPAP